MERVRAGKMVLQNLDNGLRLNFFAKVAVPYEEKNNKYFVLNEDFGIGDIRKLLANGVIEEVTRGEVVLGCSRIGRNKKVFQNMSARIFPIL